MTLEELRLTPLYKKNADFYDLIIDRYKGITNHKNGFNIYFYEQEQIDYSSHEEFKYYNYQEKYRLLVLLALGFLLLEFLLRSTVFKSFI